MEYSLKEFRFNGQDPIRVLSFLAKFVEEAELLHMTEAQAFLALPKLLLGFAKEQYDSVRGSADASEGGVSCWPEAVQYLLRSYATSSAINAAITALRAVTQTAQESERDFSSRLSLAFARCGNAHPSSEKIQFFLDGLDPAIKSLVARYRERHRKATFLELVQFAQAEGEAKRAREAPSRSDPLKPALRKPVQTSQRKGGALLIESVPTTEEQSDATHSAEPEQVNLIGSDFSSTPYPISIPTSELPSTATDASLNPADDPALAIQSGYRYGRAGQRQSVPAPRVPYQNHAPHMANTRPGWTKQQDPVKAAQARNAQSEWICHSCYARGDHLSPQCNVTIRELEKVVRNYEELSEQERERVPVASYSRFKSLVHPSHRQPPVTAAPQSGN